MKLRSDVRRVDDSLTKPTMQVLESRSAGPIGQSVNVFEERAGPSGQTFDEFCTITEPFGQTVERSYESFEPIGQTEETFREFVEPFGQTTEESLDSFEPIGQSTELSENSEPIGQAVVQRTLQLSILNYNDNVCMKVRNAINYWMTIGTCAFLLDMIAYGYKIPFLETPPPSHFRNNQSAIKNANFVKTELLGLLGKGYVEKLTGQPRVVNPLSVATNSRGKSRLILDLRHVNLHLYKFSVKYESFDSLKTFVQQDGYMVKFDLKSGYHHIGIFEEHQTYLGFAWDMGNGLEYYKFRVLPFGLSSACSIFTKFLKPLIGKWRNIGIKIIMYLDDGFITSDRYATLLEHIHIVQSDLSRCGLTLNEAKCIWKPSSCMEWLGLITNLNRMTFSVPVEKRLSIYEYLTKLRKTGYATARELSRIVGYLVSIKLAVGPRALLSTRYLQMAISEAPCWEFRIHFTSEIFGEFSYWSKKLGYEVSWPIYEREAPPSACSLFTDASASGGGGFIEQINQSDCHFSWSTYESLSSSTYRELKALYKTLVALKHLVPGKTFIWFTDNQNVVRIFNHGSMKKDLQDLAMAICDLCENYSLRIYPRWIPRSLNWRADRLSKFSDNGNWQVNENIFKYFDIIWGPYTFDRFADDRNSKCEKFNSLHECPKSSGVNALNFDWSNQNNWLVPPTHLIANTILHLKRCKAYGTLVIPKWTSSGFWSLLRSDNGYRKFVIEFVEYLKPKNFFVAGNNTMFTEDINFDVVVLKMNFVENI